jgi:hypothetical protein
LDFGAKTRPEGPNPEALHAGDGPGGLSPSGGWDADASFEDIAEVVRIGIPDGAGHVADAVPRIGTRYQVSRVDPGDGDYVDGFRGSLFRRASRYAPKAVADASTSVKTEGSGT